MRWFNLRSTFSPPLPHTLKLNAVIVPLTLLPTSWTRHKIRGTAKTRDSAVLLSSVRHRSLVIRILPILYHHRITNGGLHGYATNQIRQPVSWHYSPYPHEQNTTSPELVAMFCPLVWKSCWHLPSLEECQGLTSTTIWLRPKACHIAC